MIKVEDGGNYDVLVAGGGPAGFCAAVAAARGGAKVLLVESTGCLGGMLTSGLLGSFCAFHDGEKFIHRGIAMELHDCLRADRGKPHTDNIAEMCAIDPEVIKRSMDAIAAKSGCEVLFFTTLAGVEMAANGMVEAAIIANKGGLFRVKGKLFIDATGDASLCNFAGAQTLKGDERGDMQPISLCVAMIGVSDKDAPVGYKQKIVADPEFPSIKDDFFFPGFRMNAGHIWDIDGSDAKGMSKGMVSERILAKELRDAFRKYLPNSKDAELIQTPCLPGIRETRRIVGEYVLCAADHRERRRFADEIAVNNWYIDIHYSWENYQRLLRGEWSRQKEKADSRYSKGEFHGIPYRCLLPKGLKNVIVAGRSISSDRVAQSAVRLTPPCMSMGQAAGTAAALLLQAGSNTFGNLDVELLRDRLRADGAFLPS